MTKDMETFAVAARSPREGPWMTKIGANDELTGCKSEIGSLGRRHTPDFVTQDTLTEPIEVLVRIQRRSQ